MKSIKGPAWCLGEGIDTDVIAPGAAADFYGLDAEGERALLADRAFRALPDARATLTPGAVLVAGRNFGGGSHRERANRALPALGVVAVVAESVARIFFRNAIALGQPCFEAPGVSEVVADGEPILLDLAQWQAVGPGGQVPIKRYSPRVIELVEAGGTFGLMRAKWEARKP